MKRGGAVVPIRKRLKPAPAAAAVPTRDPVAVLASLNSGDVAGVVGLPGSGKSYTSQEAAKRLRRVIVFDPYAIRNLLAWELGERARRPWAVALGVAPLTLAELYRNPGLIDRSPSHLVISASLKTDVTEDSASLASEFSSLVGTLWLSGGGITLFAEESALYNRAAVPAVLRLSTGGAHGGMSLVLLAQRFGRMHIDARANLTTLVAGVQQEEIDVDALKERAGKAFSQQVTRLPKRKQLVWQLGDRAAGEQ